MFQNLGGQNAIKTLINDRNFTLTIKNNICPYVPSNVGAHIFLEDGCEESFVGPASAAIVQDAFTGGEEIGIEDTPKTSKDATQDLIVV